MGQATSKFSVEIKNGGASPYKFEAESPATRVDAYMPLQTLIRNDDKWHTIRLDAGDKEFVKMLTIKSDKYQIEGCPSGGYLYLEFIKDEKDKVVNAMKMDGPHVYLGPALDLLPQKLEAIRFKNKLTEPVTVDILIGKTAVVEEHADDVSQNPDPVPVGSP